MKTNDLLILT